MGSMIEYTHTMVGLGFWKCFGQSKVCLIFLFLKYYEKHDWVTQTLSTMFFMHLSLGNILNNRKFVALLTVIMMMMMIAKMMMVMISSAASLWRKQGWKIATVGDGQVSQNHYKKWPSESKSSSFIHIIIISIAKSTTDIDVLHWFHMKSMMNISPPTS